MSKCPCLDLQRVGFSFARFGDPAAQPIFDGFSLSVETGSAVAIMGSSGVGKSTLAALMARKLTPQSGTIDYCSSVHLPYDVTYVDQSPMNSVFPWQTVSGNIEYPLRKLKWPAKRIKERVSKLVESFRLTSLLHSFPARLSGGELQRLALARHLSWQPRIMILDEVFTALDIETRTCSVAALKAIVREENTTVVMVTHNVSDALSLADRCIILGGRPAVAVYDFPVEDGNISEAVFRQTLRRAIRDGYI
jgi:NitT/TauT family transport system ATP-binding protein